MLSQRKSIEARVSQNTVLNQVKETVEGTIQVMLLCGEHSDHLWAIFRKKEVTKSQAQDEFGS